MAKVKGPLFSMGASGQLGKSLVFMTWKGIKDVRSHVIPANPQTDPQMTQRGYMTDAVTLWHDTSINTLDAAAYNVLASIQSAIMSGFNAFCKWSIATLKAGDSPVAPCGMVVSAQTGTGFSISLDLDGVSAGKYRYGLSPSVMGDGGNFTHALEGDPYTASLTGLVEGTYIYLQAYTEVAGIVWIAGIYKILVEPAP
jgi:hypothetical protein